MKNRFIIWTIFSFVFFGCEKEEAKPVIKTDPAPPSITSHSNGFTKVISEENLSEVIALAWSAADYGVKTQLTYVVQLDSAERSFADPVILGTTQHNSVSMTIGELNAKLLLDLKITPNVESSLEIRVLSSINGQYTVISPTVSITVKPLKLFDANNPPSLWVPGGYQGWNPGSAPVIYGTSETEFEGYVYINEGSAFKFTSHPDWNHINYGDSGTPGVLTTDGLAGGLSAPEAGYYRFKVNIENLTYEIYRVESFGLIGTATPGSWDHSTAMVYDADNDLWTATLDLTQGALKFRANNDWWLNYGPEDSNLLSGKLIQTNDAITINEAGNYTVVLDFSKSVSPRHYKYSVVKNQVVPAPPRLWIPGGYQQSGGDPSQSDALSIYAVSETDDQVFEGYVTVPASTWIKFTSAPDWGHTNYGSAGSGSLTIDGNAPGIDVPAAGYYKITVNIQNLTYSLTRIDSWGLVGDATPGSWFESTAMTFDETSKTWSKTLDLANGAVKFRANNGWDVNYGPADSNALSGNLIQTDAAISISEAGNYTITIDLSRSAPSYAYSYSVVKN